MSLPVLTIQSHVVAGQGDTEAVMSRDVNLIAMQEQLRTPAQHFADVVL